MLNKNYAHPPSKYVLRAIILIVIVLAARNWYLRPDAAGEWIFAMLILPLLGGFMTLYGHWALRLQAPEPDDEAVLSYSGVVGRFFLFAIAAGGLSQVISLGFKLAGALGLTSNLELAGRIKILGVVIIFVLLGNAIRKILTPQSLLPGGGALRIGTARHFLGWAWVLLGFAMVLLDLLLPFGVLKLAAKWMIVAAIFAVPAAIIWIDLPPVRRQP